MISVTNHYNYTLVGSFLRGVTYTVVAAFRGGQYVYWKVAWDNLGVTEKPAGVRKQNELAL
jgi:hypothetical protein